MAIESLGLSFLPRGGSDDDPAGPGGRRLEDIIQLLSFRLPRILGARPIAPQELLESPGGSDPLGSAIASAVVNSVLRGSPTVDADLSSPSPFNNALRGAATSGAPTPRVIPVVPNPPPGWQPQPPRTVPIEPAPEPVTPTPREPHRGTLDDSFDAVGSQLRRGQNRWPF